MEKIEKGSIIEIKVPNVEEPIKAVVLDKESIGDDHWTRNTYIMYAKNKIFRMSDEVYRQVYVDDETGEPQDCYQYCGLEGYKLILNNCTSPNIPTDI